MADVKTLQTRLQLKYDSYTNWTDESKEGQGANLVLLKGEIGICEIPSGNTAATTAPTVLFKIGDGTKAFKDLKWASALAADVYAWAKADDVVLEGKSIKFVKGSGEDRVVIKEVAIPYVTEAEVKAITDPLASRIAAVEAALGADDGSADSFSARMTAIEGAVETLTGADTVDGSVAKALKDAKAYTDEREVEIKKYADQAEADALSEAKKYTDAREVEITKTTDALAAKDTELAGLIGGNTDAIGDVADDLAQELLDRAAGDKAITDSIGTVAEGKTVVKMIEDAQAAAEANAKTETEKQVKALADGAVATNAADIDKLEEAIAALNGEEGTLAGINAAIEEVAGDLETAVGELEKADQAIIDKIGDVGEGTVAVAVADAKKAGTDAQGQVTALANGAVAQNTSDIADLKAEFDEGGRVTALETASDDHEGRIVAMEAFFEGAASDEGEGENLKNALDTLKEIQDFATGEGTAAAEMLDAIDANAKAIKAVEDIVKDGGTLEVRVDAAESDIDALEGKVGALETLTAGFGEGETVSEKIADAAALGQQGIDDAKDAQDAADKAQKEVDELEGVVGTLRSEYDVTKALATTNASDIDALEVRMGTAEGEIDALQAASHTHANKAELDKIVEGDKAKWDEAYEKRHEHANKAELDLIASGDVAKWNTAVGTANQAAADMATVIGETGRLTVAEGEIDALQAIVVSGADSNEKLGKEIDDLVAIVVNGADGNVALGGEIDALAAVVNHTTTGLAATKAIADEAKTDAEDAQSRVGAIESDYLKQADWFIIDCGSSQLREGEPVA